MGISFPFLAVAHSTLTPQFLHMLSAPLSSNSPKHGGIDAADWLAGAAAAIGPTATCPAGAGVLTGGVCTNG